MTPVPGEPAIPGGPEIVTYRSGRGRWVIVATVLGSGMAAIDATVIGIALPTIGRDFHATLGTLQWVVTGYTLTLASLLLLGGSLGDRYGSTTGVRGRGGLVRRGLGGMRPGHRVQLSSSCSASSRGWGGPC